MPRVNVAREAACRFVGQGYEVTIPVADPEPYRLEEAFLHAHLARYGHAGGGQPMELVNLRVVARRPALTSAAAVSLLRPRHPVTGVPDDPDAEAAFALVRAEKPAGMGALRFRSQIFHHI